MVNEPERAPLVACSWTNSSLSKLFALNFEPLELETDVCTQCGRVVYHTFDKDEAWWKGLLEGIKGDGSYTNSIDAKETTRDETNSYEREDEIQDCDPPVSTASSTSKGADEDLCWQCGIMQRIYSNDYKQGRL